MDQEQKICVLRMLLFTELSVAAASCISDQAVGLQESLAKAVVLHGQLLAAIAPALAA